MTRTDMAGDTMVNGRDSADLTLAFTLCARLCHDLAGTVGALAGTLDMVGAEGDREALDLAKDCARELTARLRLLRVAWGSDGSGAELPTLLAGLPGADRLQVDLSGLSDLDEALGRLAANLLLLAAQSLPRGGTIGLSGGAAGLVLHIAGPRAAWPSILESCLGDPSQRDAALASHRNVGVAVTCRLADQLGLPISLPTPTRLLAGSPP